MRDVKEMLKEKLLLWEKQLNGFSLPAWEAFPELPLYMDQVIFLMNGYLSILPGEPVEKLITPAMINNYVKLKIIPPPVKKRYGRKHLAFLIMVCMLKQSISTGEIKRLAPSGLTEEETRILYEGFLSVFRREQESFCRAVRREAARVFSPDGEPVAHLVFHAAAEAGLFRMLAAKVLEMETEAGDRKQGD